MTIHFKKGEYDLYLDDESVGISLDTIKKKILSRSFQRFANIAQRIAKQREELEQTGLDIVALEWWLELHAKRYKSGYLTPVKGLSLLKAFADLLHDADAGAINLALQKVVAMNNPEKCTIAYLKAVVGNPPEKKLPLTPSRRGITPEAIWNTMIKKLEQRINAPSFNTWLRPMRFLEFSENVLRIGVPDTTYIYWLNTYYSLAIRQEWKTAGGPACRIEIIENAGC